MALGQGGKSMFDKQSDSVLPYPLCCGRQPVDLQDGKV